ncbi:hypothetical protein [Pseudomonas purpurea]|uniref:hypothetical protein n=1 Tax=Pseudomonas purpurea TaxID=3136737 RepID=UPI0032672296
MSAKPAGMIRGLSIVCLTLMLSGCELIMIATCAGRPDIEIQPGNLPVANAGQPYYVRLEVPDTRSPVSGFYVDPAMPLPQGLELVYLEQTNQAQIQGTPTIPGVYNVSVYTSSYGTQCIGQSAQRTYKLNVRAPARS